MKEKQRNKRKIGNIAKRTLAIGLSLALCLGLMPVMTAFAAIDEDLPYYDADPIIVGEKSPGKWVYGGTSPLTVTRGNFEKGNTEPGANEGTPKYQWKRDGGNIATTATYAPVATDFGKTITVDVTAVNDTPTDGNTRTSTGVLIGVNVSGAVVGGNADEVKINEEDDIDVFNTTPLNISVSDNDEIENVLWSDGAAGGTFGDATKFITTYTPPDEVDAPIVLTATLKPALPVIDREFLELNADGSISFKGLADESNVDKYEWYILYNGNGQEKEGAVQSITTLKGNNATYTVDAAEVLALFAGEVRTTDERVNIRVRAFADGTAANPGRYETSKYQPVLPLPSVEAKTLVWKDGGAEYVATWEDPADPVAPGTPAQNAYDSIENFTVRISGGGVWFDDSISIDITIGEEEAETKSGSTGEMTRFHITTNPVSGANLKGFYVASSEVTSPQINPNAGGTKTVTETVYVRSGGGSTPAPAPSQGAPAPTAPAPKAPVQTKAIYTVSTALIERTGPGTSCPSPGRLAVGAIVEVLEISADGQWARCNTGTLVPLSSLTHQSGPAVSGTTATASASIGAFTPYTVNVSAGSRLNVRAAASGTSARVGTLRRGDVVKVLSIDGGWAKIAYTPDVPVAYVSAAFITK